MTSSVPLAPVVTVTAAPEPKWQLLERTRNYFYVVEAHRGGPEGVVVRSQNAHTADVDEANALAIRLTQAHNPPGCVWRPRLVAAPRSTPLPQSRVKENSR